MVEIKTERTFKFEDGVAIAIKKDSWVNAAGKEMCQITEEKGITREEAEKVVSELIDKEKEKQMSELEKLQKQYDELNEEVSKFESSPEYIEFKKYLESDEVKEMFSKLNKINTRDKLNGQLKEVHRIMNDIDLWNTQMGGILEEFKKNG